MAVDSALSLILVVGLVTVLCCRGAASSASIDWAILVKAGRDEDG